jgi:hypothetical protein
MQRVATWPATAEGFALMLLDAFAASRLPGAKALPGCISAEGARVTSRYALEVLAEDEGLIDQSGDARFTMTSRLGNNDLQVSVLETLDQALAAEWRRILDDSGRTHVARVLEANEVASEQSLRRPPWRSA